MNSRKLREGSAVVAGVLGLLLLAGGPTLAAGPVFWDWPADRAMDELELEGATLDDAGHLVAGMTARPLGPDGPEVCWTAVPDGDGGYFTGTGHGGEIHHLDAQGKGRVHARLEGTEIFALLRLPGGDLLAGCGPEGYLFRVGRDGAARVVGTVAEGYVWALSAGADGRVWIAAGSPAALYRYGPADDAFGRVAGFDAQNALDVLARPDGGVLVATQGPGLVFRVDAKGQSRLVHETAQDEARQFIIGPEGAVFLLALRTADDLDEAAGRPGGVAPSPPPALLALLGGEPTPETPAAALYRIGEDDRVETWWSGPDELLTAAWSERWGWLAGGPLGDDESHATLQRLIPPRSQHVLARWEGGDVLQILVDPDGGEPLAACQAHPGAVVVLGDNGHLPRQATSPPLDGGRPVQWGRLGWQGDAPQAGLRWSVRGGNRSVPDETWTAWSDAWTDADHAIDLPPTRFLQWRVAFPAGRKATGARVTSVAVSAWQDNLPPVIADFQLEQLQDITLGGMISGSDNVTQRFRSGLQAEFSRGAAEDDWPGPVRGGLGRPVRIFTWQGSDPNGDRLTYRLAYRRQGGDAWRPLPTSRPDRFETRETLLSWDTTEVADGVYEVRLTASDERDNPAGRTLGASRILGPIRVDNTAPEITDFRLEAIPTGFRVRCRARDAGHVLGGARIFLPDGSVERLDPVDRICDSPDEKFAAEVAWPRDGAPTGVVPWRVRLEVRDLAGNLQVVEGDVR
ncbi:hypothetical protein KDM41_17110 [bacterium]|nr:hypothetical protein [bacterium]